MTDGCPVCDWDGEVAETYDYKHRYYTHVIVKNDEMFKGRTCSERSRPRTMGPFAWFREVLRG